MDSRMGQCVEQTFPLPWSEMGSMDKGPWGFSGGSSGMPANMECAPRMSVSQNPNSPTDLYYQAPEPQENPHGDAEAPYPLEDTLVTSRLPPQLIQETFGVVKGISASMPMIVGLQEPLLSREFQDVSHLNSGSSVVMNSQVLSPFARSNGRDRLGSQQSNPLQAAPTWCQSYINGPRTRSLQEGMATDRDSLGKGSQEEMDGRGGSHDAHFSRSLGDAQVELSQITQTVGHQARQQMQGGQGVFVPLFGTHTGVAQPQGAAAVVAGTARPRVRARRGQATDPHSIAERLRRERIAERMKALQELVPNANKTDKASMLDEIIDYVKFLQLQVKVLSMSRLGGAGAVAPLIVDFPVEGQNNLVAALGSADSFQDGVVVAEHQVARLMEEDMGSAMQFLQAKGLCLMPVSLATAISSNSSRSIVGGGGQQGFSAVDRSWINAASSTSSTLASVASSSCAGVEGDSNHGKGKQ